LARLAGHRQERRTVDQIKQLRKSRDMVKLYNDRLERLQVS
jgi:hypothetical protein